MSDYLNLTVRNGFRYFETVLNGVFLNDTENNDEACDNKIYSFGDPYTLTKKDNTVKILITFVEFDAGLAWSSAEIQSMTTNPLENHNEYETPKEIKKSIDRARFYPMSF